MAWNTMWFNLFAFVFCGFVLNTRITANVNDGFWLADKEVQYISFQKEFSSTSRVRIPVPTHVEDSSHVLKFDPPLLDFKERHLGIPHHEKVTLFNVDENKTIHMSSISGSTVHFHSSFFDDKVVHPLGNTTFNVVFLGRVEGAIESSLFIHTSEGSFRYQVRGASISSPYRLRPLVGVRLPLNSTYRPVIYVYNPFPRPLQVVEAYSSGGDFHLELPSGVLEAPQNIWQVPPFHTKPVVKIRFVADAHKNHTAYVRLRVNHSDEALVVPLEVQVGQRPGLYSQLDMLDFGLGGSCDQPRQLFLQLYNSASKPIRIQSVVAKPASKALKIDFQPIKLLPNLNSPTRVAVITFDWALGTEADQVSGRLLVRGKQGQHKLVLPFIARPLPGCLAYNASLAQFCSDGEHGHSPRHFTVTNTFRVPLAVLNVSLHRDAQPYFQVDHFVPRVFGPRESGSLFRLSLGRSVSVSDLKLNSNLWLHTNVSRVFVPLLCYNGRLDLVGGAVLDVGLVGCGGVVLRHVVVVNRNPLPVKLLGWGSNTTWSQVDFLGTAHGDASLVLASRVFHNLTNSTVVAPGQFAVLAVSLAAPLAEGPLLARLQLRSEFETLDVMVTGQVAHGTMRVLPDPVRLTQCFPGRSCSAQLEVRSHFSRAMNLRSVQSVPSDTRLRFLPGQTSIAPHATSTLGQLVFDCDSSHHYLGTHNLSGSWQWLQSLALPFHTAELDVDLFSYLQRQFQRSTRNLRLSLELRTSAVYSHLFQVEVQLTWPLLAGRAPDVNRSVQLPLTQVGNTSHTSFTLYNPSGQVVVAQLVLDWAYPRADHTLAALANWLGGSGGPNHSDRLWFPRSGRPEGHDLASHKDALVLVLPPDQAKTVTLAFSPLAIGRHAATIFVRNNLTVLEILKVVSYAAVPLFKFGNRNPVSGTPLLFELADKHLGDYAGEKKHLNPIPNLTVKRSFTARNYGDLPIYVTSFSINGLPCEGYGFRVLNCEAFVLLPNHKRNVDIAFTPDFTLARVQRTLGIETSLGSTVNYTLLATLPPALLAGCSATLSRPTWEPLLYYTAISLVAFLLLCMLAAAHLEANRIIKGALVVVPLEEPVHVLDLNNLSPSLPEQDDLPRSGSVTDGDVKPLLAFKSSKKIRKSGQTSEDLPALKKGWGLMFHADKSSSLASQNIVKKNEELMEVDKYRNIFKQNKKSSDMCSGEDTSSTTSDSSNDDIHKEGSEKLAGRSEHASCWKTEVEDGSVEYRDNYEGDCDDDDYERECKDSTQRWKLDCIEAGSTHATVPRLPSEPRLVCCEHRASNLELPYKLKSSKMLSRDRKDNTLLRRRCTDKTAASKCSAATMDGSGVMQLRPASSWTELKASFSDVVIGNESPSYSSVVAPRAHLAANSGFSTSPLGPIGSRIASPSGAWESVLDPAPHFLQQEPCRSTLLPEPSQCENLHYPDADIQCEEPCITTEDSPQSIIFTESWPASLWDPLCKPAARSEVLFEEEATPPNTVWGGPAWTSSPWSQASDLPAGRDTGRESSPPSSFSPFHSNNIWLPRSSDSSWSPPTSRD